jgi:hypothetical protein
MRLYEDRITWSDNAFALPKEELLLANNAVAIKLEPFLGGTELDPPTHMITFVSKEGALLWTFRTMCVVCSCGCEHVWGARVWCV